MEDYRKAKIALSIGIAIGVVYDIWFIFRGSFDLSKHLPGSIELICGLWYYAVLRLERLPRKN